MMPSYLSQGVTNRPAKVAEEVIFSGDEPKDWVDAGVNREGMDAWMRLAESNNGDFKRQMAALLKSNPQRYAAVYRAVKSYTNESR
jgi:hypothetical protein